MIELTSIPTREIRQALHRALGGDAIVRLVREPVNSHVERVRLRRASGERQVLIAKLGSRTGENREMLAYLHVLSPDETCSPRMLGAVQEQGWLFLEEAAGREPVTDDAAQVQAMYETLAGVHRRMAGRAPRLMDGPAGGALRSSFRTTPSAAAYEGWFHRAYEALQAAGMALPLLARAAEVSRRLESTGLTLVHGDFHAGNVRLEGDVTRLLDWEDCGIGSPLHDLVYLEPEDDGWPGAPRGALAWFALQVYHEVGPLSHVPWDEFLLAQRSARLWDRIRLVALHAENVVRAREEGAPPGVLDVMKETLGASLARSVMAARTLGW